MTLLSIYGLTIAAAMLLSAGLAVLGAHIATRDKAVQTLCLGQGAMLGVITGIGLAHALDLTGVSAGSLPFASAAICATLTFAGSERLLRDKHAAKNTVLVSLFAVLLAAGHLASALFPGLEHHMTQRYFGDLATVSREESLAILGVAAALLFTLTKVSRHLLRDSFNTAVLGRAARSSSERSSGLMFNLIVVCVLAASVQVVGFLFTTVCLFLPTTLMKFCKIPGTGRHLRLSIAIATVGTGSGFLLSLFASRLPTVPTITAVMALTGLIISRLPAAPEPGAQS